MGLVDFLFKSKKTKYDERAEYLRKVFEHMKKNDISAFGEGNYWFKKTTIARQEQKSVADSDIATALAESQRKADKYSR